MANDETITLVGGPGDGETYPWRGGDLLEWRAIDAREQVASRMHGRPVSVHDPVRYRRSLRTRTMFVYQP